MGRQPGKPDNGQVGMPRVDAGNNRVAPVFPRGAGKRTDSDADRPLGAKDRETGKDKAARHTKLRERMVKRFDRAALAEANNRKEGLEDLKMKAGDQWPSDIKNQRAIDKRPCHTINKLPTFTHQITNELRQNRPAININPVGDRGDVEVAKMYRGLIRAIERDSAADIAYDTGADSAVSNGFGYWRLLTEWEAPDSFNKIITVGRVRNPFSVYLDPNHVQPDGSDAQWGFISEMMPREEFKEQYPDKTITPWTQAGVGETSKNWMTRDEIRVAEYFEIEHKRRTLVKLDTGHEGWRDELDAQTLAMIAKGDIEVIDERESDCQSVMWYKATAADILIERPWPGKWIPIVKVIGEEIDIEGNVIYSGVIRNAKDSQRNYNYWTTKLTEAIALSPNAPWVMEEGQISGHAGSWRDANIRSTPYLLYKGVALGGRPAPPPSRQPFAGIPAGIVQAREGAAQDMMGTTGIRFDSTMNERLMDESGKAIKELRRTGDIGSFHYVDNMARSLRRTGELFIDLIPKVYDTKRVVTILREDDTEEQVQIDPALATGTGEQRNAPGRAPAGDPMAAMSGVKLNAKKTAVMKIFNPTYGRYGVTVTIGPSYATKRIEASENMIAFARALPQTAMLFADLIAKYQDWPGAEEITARIAKTLPANLLQTDTKDMSPQAQALMQSMDSQIKQLTTQLQQAMAALTDKAADRQVAREKIERDFEAKLLGVVAGIETKMAAVQERAVSNFNTHIGAQIKGLGEHVTTLVHAFEGQRPAEQNGAGAPAAAG